MSATPTAPPPRSLGARILRETARFAAWQSLGAVLAFAVNFVLSRALDKHDYGVYDICTFFVTVGGVLGDGGLGASLLRRKEDVRTEEYRVAHEQYRGFVLFHRTQAAAAREVERERPESAVNAIRDGLERLRVFFAAHDLEEQMEEDGMVRQLRRMEAALRETHQIESTLEEQLQAAIAAEDYERAAELRDLLRRQKSGGA